jgi:hypothetical protein
VLEDSSVRSTVDAWGDIDFPSRLVTRIARQRPTVLLKLLAWPRFPLAWVYDR